MKNEKIRLNVFCSKEKNLSLEIYRSEKAYDIDTIAKLKNKQPILRINELLAPAVEIMPGKMGYVVFDMEQVNQGIYYMGPEPNPIPCDLYETAVDFKMIGTTFIPYIKMNLLTDENKGTMYYYSVVGVNKETGMITEVSMVKGVIFDIDYKNGERIVYEQGVGVNEWNEIGKVSWDKNDFTIGSQNENDVTTPGVTIPKNDVIKPDDIKIDSKEVMYTGKINLILPNVWKSEYQMRKTKQYCVQNSFDKKLSQVFGPTYSMEIPVSFEEVIVTFYNQQREEYKVTIVKKNGLFFRDEYKDLGINKYLITDQIAVFSFDSVQETIVIEAPLVYGQTYDVKIELVDVFCLTTTIHKTFEAVR